MIVFFDEIASILKTASFGEFFRAKTEKTLSELKKSCSGEIFGEEFLKKKWRKNSKKGLTKREERGIIIELSARAGSEVIEN